MNTVTVTQSEFIFKVKFKVEGTSDDFQEMLSDFKTSISNRKWNPTEKVWEVPNIYEKNLKGWCFESEWWDIVEWCGKAFDGTTKTEEASYQEKTSYQSTQQKSSANSFEDFADLDNPIRKETEKLYNVLYLTSEAPMELVDKVWKMLMLLYHPDKGGDTTKAAAINAAYQKIKESKK